MQGNMYDLFDADRIYERKLYNVFINSSVTTNNMKNRSFTTFDIFPTTLAALGFQIDEDKLGLGVNLFSEEKTLLEKNNFDTMNDELEKKSEYYNKVLNNK